MEKAYVIGVDYGTDSVRAIVVDAYNGNEMAASTFEYPRWKKQLYCNAETNVFRQHPLDYIEGLQFTIKDCLQKTGDEVRHHIKAISIDTTGSSPIAVDETGTPLALSEQFAHDPDAMFVLWKDHSSAQEAEEINQHAKNFEINYLKYVGGIYSSEWYWSKLLHVLRNNRQVKEACHGWVEHADWMPFLLTGGKHISELKRGICTAGHKGLWAEEWNGFPPEDFFVSLDGVLSGFVSMLPSIAYTADKAAGNLSQEWAGKLGLSTTVLIGIGAMDAHMGAVGGQVEPYYLSKVMGTSTCDMLVAPIKEMQGKYVQGICGLVNGSVIPGMIGMEAGQSAFGDVYAWLRNVVAWPLENIAPGLVDEQTIKNIVNRIIPELSKQAAATPLHEKDELSVDWFNGRRTPDANALLKASITGLDLGTDAVKIFRSLAEATCFGARAIVECFTSQHIAVKGLIGIGGVARKSPFIMQMMADVMNMSIRINKSEQTCALGAAMFAATIAGIYNKVEEAMQVMGQGFDTEYYPDKSKVEIYRQRYSMYLELGVHIESKIAK
ncbi:ribulokinase [Foetidibacter luteolus]|uniref:ribulokinase n=1 Tax=Foetidibacter luteolus TaxID=2608880 RepID=UPI00129B5E37|nr:ribulokinase [Foetidibacter luteolus]